MAHSKDKRFFRINAEKLEKNIVRSKMTNEEKNYLIKVINDKNYHLIYCYAKMLYKKYAKKHNNYEIRMKDLFMTREDKKVFYA